MIFHERGREKDRENEHQKRERENRTVVNCVSQMSIGQWVFKWRMKVFGDWFNVCLSLLYRLTAMAGVSGECVLNFL